MISFIVEVLLENAIDYSYRGTEIKANLLFDNDFCELVIQNQGMATDRSGLSLYLAKMVIAKHGGKIWFKSDANKTTFHVRFPLAV